MPPLVSIAITAQSSVALRRQVRPNEDLPQRAEEHPSEALERTRLRDRIVRADHGECRELAHEIRNQNPDYPGGDDRRVRIVSLPDARIERARGAPDIEVAVVAHVLEAVEQILLSVAPDERQRVEHPAPIGSAARDEKIK